MRDNLVMSGLCLASRIVISIARLIRHFVNVVSAQISCFCRLATAIAEIYNVSLIKTEKFLSDQQNSF